MWDTTNLKDVSEVNHATLESLIIEQKLKIHKKETKNELKRYLKVIQ
jgi:hypothetical protein